MVVDGAPVAESIAVQIEGVSVSFDDHQVFNNLDCSFRDGEITVIIGGSGCGKSTLLKLVGGLTPPDSGSIVVAGDDITRLGERRMYEVRDKLGMMFQGGALLDSLSVFENLAFPLREHTSMSEAEIAEQVHDRLEAVGLNGFDKTLPGKLSGGMRKRAALARAIIRRPLIFLCDEPFSGLDPISAKRIEALIVRINKQFNMTTLLVSHHIASTLRMADRILVLLPDGAVAGTPEELQSSSDQRIYNLLSEEVSEDIADLESEAAAASPPGNA